MRLRLKEDPQEFLKFALVCALALALLSFLLWHKGWIHERILQGALLGGSLLLGVGWFRPRSLRPLYRGAMTGSFYMGQGIGRVALVLIFILLVTPMGLLLRLVGKDLLNLRRTAGPETYWKPARPDSPLDRLF